MTYKAIARGLLEAHRERCALIPRLVERGLLTPADGTRMLGIMPAAQRALWAAYHNKWHDEFEWNYDFPSNAKDGQVL